MSKKKSLVRYIARITHGLSFRRDPSFVPNLVLCLGIVFVWRGLRNLIDTYFYPEHRFLSNVGAIVIGIFLIYLPDNSFTQLGGFSYKEKDKDQLIKETSKTIKKSTKSEQ